MKRQCIMRIITTGLLVGSSQASLFDTTARANDDRVIIKSKTFNFRRHARTACRTTSSYTGSRSKGEIERYKNMSGTKCKQKCVQMEEKLNGVCFGYEISNGGQCEIWKVRVGKLEDLAVSGGANCYTREGSIVDGINYVPAIGSLAADNASNKARFAEFGGYSCRTQDGRGENGREFNMIKRISNDDCNRSCRLVGDDCYGYEYSLSRRSCKIWTEPIEDVKNILRGINCYIKEGKQVGALSPIYLNDNIDNNDGNIGKFAINGYEVDSVQDSSGTDWVLDKNIEWEEKVVNDTGTYDWTEFYRDVNTIKIAEDFKDDNDRPGYITGKGTIEFDFKESNVIRCLKNSNNCEKVADIVSVTKGRDTKPFGELPSNSNNCSPTKQVRITKVAIKRAGSDEGSYQVTFDARKYYPNENTKNKECKQEDDGYCRWSEDGEEQDIDAPKRFVGEKEKLKFGALEDVGKDKDLITEASLEGKFWYVDTCDSYEVIAVSPYNANAQKRSSCIDVKPKLLKDKDVFTCENFSVSEITGDVFVWHIEIKPASDSRGFRLFSSP